MSRAQRTCARNTGQRERFRMRCRRVAWLLVLCTCLVRADIAAQPVWSVAPGAEGAPPPSSTPSHVFITPCLRPLIDEMLRRSPTFRAQMDRLARTRALGIAIALKASTSRQPAEASIRHYDSGLMLALVSIHSVSDKEELIAHEIEHVLEQIERVPLARLARAGSSVWATGNSYETLRAIDAGRRVAKEVRESDNPAQ
jgi:hypothetical protein